MKKLKSYLSHMMIASSFILAGSTIAQVNSPTTLMSMSDTGFISKNIMDNMMEIQLSEMGRDRATNPQIKKLASQMIKDHTQMLADLRKAGRKMNMMGMNDTATRMGTGMPDDMSATTSEAVGATGTDTNRTSGRTTKTDTTTTSNATGSNQANTSKNPGMRMGSSMNSTQSMNDLQTTAGAAFDKMWTAKMLTMHDAKIAELQTAASTIKNFELKSVVTKALPKVMMHRDMLARIDAGSGGNNQ
jgi:predicted outer membrane protein